MMKLSLRNKSLEKIIDELSMLPEKEEGEEQVPKKKVLKKPLNVELEEEDDQEAEAFETEGETEDEEVEDDSDLSEYMESEEEEEEPPFLKKKKRF